MNEAALKIPQAINLKVLVVEFIKHSWAIKLYKHWNNNSKHSSFQLANNMIAISLTFQARICMGIKSVYSRDFSPTIGLDELLTCKRHINYYLSYLYDSSSNSLKYQEKMWLFPMALNSKCIPNVCDWSFLKSKLH